MKHEDPGAPGEDALFIATVNGRVARCEVVAGLDGVAEAFLQAAWSGAAGVMPEGLAALHASLRDPAAWAVHGVGDGQPFWHWWAGLGEGSISFQRLTAPLPVAEGQGPAPAMVAASLRACAAELRLAAQQAGGSLRILPGTGAEQA